MPPLRLPIVTRRLTLREFLADDAPAIFDFSSDPRVTRYLFFGPRDADSARTHLREVLKSQRAVPRTRFELAVEHTASGRVIGACELALVEGDDIDLGYMLEHASWGQGFATEIALALADAAFYDLRAERVISTVDVGNLASIRVLEKVGMRWEATYRKARRAKNRWWDCHLYTLARPVWEATER